jgi:hypothetical protein
MFREYFSGRARPGLAVMLDVGAVLTAPLADSVTQADRLDTGRNSGGAWGR